MDGKLMGDFLYWVGFVWDVLPLFWETYLCVCGRL